MKTVIIKLDSAPMHEFSFLKIEDEDILSEIQADPENEELLTDYYWDHDDDVIYGPIYLEGSGYLHITVDDEVVYSDFVNIGKDGDFDVVDILYKEDLLEDEEYYNIERNGYRETYDNEAIMGMDDKIWKDAIIRDGVSKGFFNFEFEIKDDEEFDVDKLKFLYDTDENDFLGDEEINPFHILYGNRVIESDGDFDSGEEKLVEIRYGVVYKDGTITIKD